MPCSCLFGPAPVTDHTWRPGTDDEGRIVRFMLLLQEFHFEALQENTPDHLHLLLRKRQTDAAVPAAAKSDQRVGALAILFAARCEPVRIIRSRIAEHFGKA